MALQLVSKKSVKAQVSEALENRVKKRVNMRVLGNQDRCLKDLCADLINNSTLDQSEIAHICYLHPTTVKKLAAGITKYPRADTCERILRSFQLELSAGELPLDPKYRNQKK